MFQSVVERSSGKKAGRQVQRWAAPEISSYQQEGKKGTIIIKSCGSLKIKKEINETWLYSLLERLTCDKNQGGRVKYHRKKLGVESCLCTFKSEPCSSKSSNRCRKMPASSPPGLDTCSAISGGQFLHQSSRLGWGQSTGSYKTFDGVGWVGGSQRGQNKKGVLDEKRHV